MPVKITSSTTSTVEGKIKKGDLNQMKTDFGEVQVLAMPPKTVIKKLGFYFAKSQFKSLFEWAENTHPNSDLVKVTIAVQVDNTTEVCDIPQSYAMATVIEMVAQDIQKNRTALNSIDDFVLINSYEDFDMPKLAIQCCPSTDPPSST